MGEAPKFTFGKLFIAVLCRPDVDVETLLTDLALVYGPVKQPTRFFSFAHTAYYEPEMGPDLRRFFVVIEALYDPSQLAETKLNSTALEKKYADGQGRRVNLDPGILFLHNLILLSTKNFAHRIPLSQGIYAEVTLIYQNKKWVSLPWTFPDYQTEGYHALFHEIRHDYQIQLLRRQR